MNQSGGFAIVNYIISVLASVFAVLAVPVAGYSIWNNQRARATRANPELTAALVAEYTCRGEVSLYRGPFILLRRVAFCIAMGLYPHVPVYCLLITSFIYTLSIVSIIIFEPYRLPLKNWFVVLFEALSVLTLVLIMVLFLVDFSSQNVIPLSWVIFAIIIINIALAVAFLVYEIFFT